MTRCKEFYEKWEKDPNWCDHSRMSVSRIDTYLDLVLYLERKFDLDIETIYRCFSENQCRVLCREDAELRERALEKIGAALQSQQRRITTKDINTFLGHTYTIYFVHGGPFVKIGTTRCTDDRLRTLQTGNPYKLKVIAELEGEKESEFHRRFDHLKTEADNEWYFYAKELRDFIEKEV